LLFINTHWDYAGKRARAESARLTRRMIRALQPAGATILVGDFNGTEDDEPYAQLLRGQGDDADPGPVLLDSYRACHPQRLAAEATYHGFGGGDDGSRIDWILHTDDLLTTAADIDRHREAGRFPSDHFPVTAVLVRK
jgi:endonuclease/exonuclease/phosphatase family metal-dependent hydrolase